MFWADQIAAESSDREHVVNDSKTPSGRVHVGSLRGVVIHDVIYRALKQAGKPVRFLYGVDDYDALDTVPHYLDAVQFSHYLGYPLCNVPSPQEAGRSEASDYAKYFMGEFLEVFEALGVQPQIYYLRDLYRSGQLNESIDLFLQNAHLVREVYLKVSKSQRSENWYPFQVICENCGKIATTTVSDYNGKEVFYTCQPDGVDWVKGCGHSGWISPFDGRGKLPWKVEWVAKWKLLGISIELAGKDHSQKGGSRDVANGLCRRILRQEPPFHSPYEFILVNGTKMSSSKGVGSSAQEISSLLPPELLRFLMLRTRPKSVINFSPNYETITRLFRDYDTLIQKFQEGNTDELSEELMPLFYAQLGEEIQPYQPFDFATLISLLQIPHLDIRSEVVSRTASPLSDRDWQVIDQRLQTAQQWLDTYADEEEKLVLYLDEIPPQVECLTPEQLEYLAIVSERLRALDGWDAETLQTTLFAITKEINLKQPIAFQAIYLAFLGKDRGPKAGSLFSYLDREFVCDRLRSVCQNASHP
jgi:lysyl-tRNA synthetase class 1